MPEWTLKTSPEEYLERFPDGPNAELARQVLDEAVVDPEAPPPPQDAVTPPKAPDLPELGSVVDYHDQISGEARPARVSHHNDDGTIHVAVFGQGITTQRTNVSRGTGKGQWEPR